MKRVVILSLLTVFLYSIIGWQWIFALRLSAHQVKEWTAFFEEENLQIISVACNAKDQNTFVVNENELYHKGKLFDIKYKERKGDEVVYYCHSDNEEEEMYTSLNQKIKDDQGTSASSKQKLLKVVKLSDFASDPCKILFDQNNFCQVIFLYKSPVKLNVPENAVFVPPDAGFQVS